MGPGERTIAIDRKDRIMKFVCPVCGYVEEFDGDQLPEDFKCPQCGVPGSRFLKQEEGQFEWLPSTSWASPRWRRLRGHRCRPARQL